MLFSCRLLQGLYSRFSPSNQVLLQLGMICLFIFAHLFPHLLWIVEVHRHRELLNCAVLSALYIALFLPLFFYFLSVGHRWLVVQC